MRSHLWTWLAVAGIAALALAAPTAASAVPLHGFCVDPTPGACADNGLNTPTTVNPPVFGFTQDGHSASGDFLVGILVPDSIAPPGDFTILDNSTSTAIGTANLLNGTTAWTSGKIGTYLAANFGTDITEGNDHTIDAYLPAAQQFAPTADGFWVYIADLGTQTVQANGDGLSGLVMTLDSQLPVGSYLLGFLCTDDSLTSCVMNANSAAIIQEGPNSCPDCHTENVPEPITLSLFGAGLAGAVAARGLRRKAKKAA